MSLSDRVIEHLEETQGQWGLELFGSLRRTDTRQCPLESLEGWPAGEVARRLGPWESHYIFRFLRHLRLPLGSKRVIWAADRTQSHNTKLRARILEASGLQEEAPTV